MGGFALGELPSPGNWPAGENCRDRPFLGGFNQIRFRPLRTAMPLAMKSLNSLIMMVL